MKTMREFLNWLGTALVVNKRQRSRYELSRFLFLRALGLIYLFAFLGIALQGKVLFGEQGLLPASRFLHRLSGNSPTLSLANWTNFFQHPTIFWLSQSNAALGFAAWAGVTLAAMLTCGFGNMIGMALLWFLYLSFVHIGQEFYAFGWDILLLETGFLAIFLCPLLDPRPFPLAPAPRAIFWLLRWLTFRIYLGAGLIKVRSDPCWLDLTCLTYHYETQPIPHPLSWLLHQAPTWFHQGGVLWNHVTELILPFFLFGPRRWRILAASLLCLFQGMLILSGNLSFLNWLTLTVTLGCFDDTFYNRWLPHLRMRRTTPPGPIPSS